jgi:hypothetical protein
MLHHKLLRPTASNVGKASTTISLQELLNPTAKTAIQASTTTSLDSRAAHHAQIQATIALKGRLLSWCVKKVHTRQTLKPKVVPSANQVYINRNPAKPAAKNVL